MHRDTIVSEGCKWLQCECIDIYCTLWVKKIIYKKNNTGGIRVCIAKNKSGSFIEILTGGF